MLDRKNSLTYPFLSHFIKCNTGSRKTVSLFYSLSTQGTRNICNPILFVRWLLPLGRRPCNTRRPAWLRRRRRSSGCSWLNKVQRVLSHFTFTERLTVTKLNLQCWENNFLGWNYSNSLSIYSNLFCMSTGTCSKNVSSVKIMDPFRT
jgi:hypothetical protein